MNIIYNARKIIFIILLFSISVPSLLYAQDNYKRKICISEWIEEMEKCKDWYYLLENTEIYFDSRKDTLYSWSQPRTIEPTEKDKAQEKNILPHIELRNCKLPELATCQVRHLIFHKNITFRLCEGAGQFIFYNCTFKQGLDIQHSNLSCLQFMHCSILHRTVVNQSEMSILSFSHCSFFTDDKLPKYTNLFGFEKENESYQYLFNFYQQDKKINTFQLSHCKFLPTKVNPIIYFNSGKYDAILFEETNFSNSIINFKNCSVKENLTVLECKFNYPLGMDKFNFPKDNSSFNWSQLDSVGLGYYTTYDKRPYTNKTDTLVTQQYIYNELNSSYRKFFSMYRTLGDIESANDCYKQLKDMETQKYHYLYQNDPGINKWFNWRFNQFLKYFSEYGTNPVQSLIISMWTILLFAGLYFFFYSDWDQINRAFLIKKHRKIMQYFRSEQHLEDFYTERYTEDLKSFANYKKEMKESKREIPAFIILLGKPLYLLSMIRHKIARFMYRRSELLQGRWTDLKPVRKIFVSLTVGFSILIYSIYLAFIRALNATMLSINAFSTLGFGAIPVKGASRYITIIEGFLGWFLLSIFSVSLISQMLQN